MDRLNLDDALSIDIRSDDLSLSELKKIARPIFDAVNKRRARLKEAGIDLTLRTEATDTSGGKKYSVKSADDIEIRARIARARNEYIRLKNAPPLKKLRHIQKEIEDSPDGYWYIVDLIKDNDYNLYEHYGYRSIFEAAAKVGGVADYLHGSQKLQEYLGEMESSGENFYERSVRNLRRR